ncbi:hypothetical protein IAU60_000067 [Kwoniella sp. DSM 27419]
MSDDLHPDLEEFYDAIAEGDDDDQWEDEDDDDGGEGVAGGGGFEVFFDPDDDDDDDDEYIDEDDIDEVYEDDDEEEEGDSDEDMGDATLQGGGDEDDDGSGAAFLELAELITRTAGDDVQAQSSLLARLFAGGTITRGGGTASVLRRIAAHGGQSEAQRQNRDRWWKPQTEPNPLGVELLKSGEFGRVGDWRAPGRSGRQRPRYSDRRLGGWAGPSIKAHHSRATIPNTPGTVVASYPSIPYVGQFAGEDYSIFYTATQYFTLHLYSTNETRKNHMSKRRAQSAQPKPPPRIAIGEEEDRDSDYEDEDEDEDEEEMAAWTDARRGIIREDTSLKKIKTVQGVEGSWTVTDCDADRKGEKMIYSSITPCVHMLYTTEFDQEHIELDFSHRGNNSLWGGYDRFGIWSIRFSADGKEVVAGASSGRIMVYDIEAQRRTLAVKGHADDTNAVCFADESSTNILVSGSDDGYVKVWDRRSLSSTTPSGVLVGATEGITYTSPKGDGRYIVANSKDQAARLYDLRKMRSWNEFEGKQEDAVGHYGHSHFDYRNMRYPPPVRHAHPKDCSVMTYRGHSVLRTLIRCHFSPRESTGQSYIYSGSADGMIHIWSLDGQIVQVLDRADAVPLRTPSGAYSDPSANSKVSQRTAGNMPWEQSRMDYTVRDVAWHGYEPTLMSTSWVADRGNRRGGTVAKHEWKGLGKNGLGKLEDWVDRAKEERGGGFMSGGLMDWSV